MAQNRMIGIRFPEAALQLFSGALPTGHFTLLSIWRLRFKNVWSSTHMTVRNFRLTEKLRYVLNLKLMA
jgi:hypothetical protein